GSGPPRAHPRRARATRRRRRRRWGGRHGHRDHAGTQRSRGHASPGVHRNLAEATQESAERRHGRAGGSEDEVAHGGGPGAAARVLSSLAERSPRVALTHTWHQRAGGYQRSVQDSPTAGSRVRSSGRLRPSTPWWSPSMPVMNAPP